MTTAADLLADKWPALKYWPHLGAVSAPQTSFLLLDQMEALYGGAAGGGKTDALLAAALQYVDVPGYAALILRRTFKQLSLPGAIMNRSKEWLRPHPEVRWIDDDKTWRFPSGATVTFGFLEHSDDIYRYQGPEFQFIGFDELTQFPEDQYVYMFSRCRRRMDVPVPVRIRAGSNPGGVGHAWVRKRFPIDPGSTPGTRQGRIFVPAKVADNPGLDTDEYIRALSELPEELRQQLMDGDWNAFEGAAYRIQDEHLVGEFVRQNAFERFEALDYGLNGAPWALWCVDYDGNLIVDDMIYERDKLPSEIAPMIVERRRAGWGRSNKAYCDPSVWHRTGTRDQWGQPAVLADEFADNGVPLYRANNDPRAGMVRLRELLACDPAHVFPDWHPRRGQYGAPRIFFRRTLKRLLEELTSAPLQPTDRRDGGEVVDPAWESRHGHAAAMCRYAVMTRPAPSREPLPWEHIPPHLRDQYLEDPAQLRAELIDQWRERQHRNDGKPVRRTERV